MAEETKVIDQLLADLKELKALLTREPKSLQEHEELRQWADRNLEHMSKAQLDLFRSQEEDLNDGGGKV